MPFLNMFLNVLHIQKHIGIRYIMPYYLVMKEKLA